jgi:hypothetical protein
VPGTDSAHDNCYTGSDLELKEETEMQTPNNLPENFVQRIEELGASVTTEGDRFRIKVPPGLDTSAVNELLSIARDAGTNIETIKGISTRPIPIDQEPIQTIQGKLRP